mgnify:CR=1 FL=1
MKEHLIIELSNGIKYVAVDVIEHNNFKYFLLTQLSNEETALSTEFDICRYDEVNNNFEYLTYLSKLSVTAFSKNTDYLLINAAITIYSKKPESEIKRISSENRRARRR